MQLDPERLRGRLQALCSRRTSKGSGSWARRVSIWQNGKPVVDLSGGLSRRSPRKPWEEADTLVLVWSATKGIGQRVCPPCAAGARDWKSAGRVAEFWPEIRSSWQRKKSRWRSCFRIKPGFALWMRELMCSTTALVIRGARSADSHCGRRGPHMVITLGHLDSYSGELVRRIAGRTLIAILARSFCAAAQSRSSGSGLPRRRERVCCDRLCCKEAAGRPSRRNSTRPELRRGTLAHKRLRLTVPDCESAG